MTSSLPGIRHLIAEALSASNDPNPSNLVPDVLSSIPEGSERAYLTEAIRMIMPQVIGSARTAAAARVGAVSMKQSLIRKQNAWQNYLQQRVYLKSGVKMFSEATLEDVRELAETRFQLAAKIHHTGERYLRIAELMDANHTVTVKELPEEAVAEAMLLFT